MYFFASGERARHANPQHASDNLFFEESADIAGEQPATLLGRFRGSFVRCTEARARCFQKVNLLDESV